MLKCNDDSLYVGVTNDITHRFDEHQNGTNSKAYTCKRRPVTLVYSSQFNDIHEAIHWEKVIKRWSRKKKEALIRNDEKSLKQLAECHNESHARNFEKDQRILSSRAETRDVVADSVMVRLRSP
jgi:putative endonuclease